ncbi:hypothetical protein PSR1_00370 [Anaeromyxobacter sp. PSR-1]|nr:hypothetical protein PSR1_00370 [Anaeromyxobacter sp. PSR-1]
MRFHCQIGAQCSHSAHIREDAVGTTAIEEETSAANEPNDAAAGSPPAPVAPPQAPIAGEHSAERSEFAYYTHGNLQEMVKLADQKAATIIGGGGIIVAVLGSNLIDKVTPADLTLMVAGTVSLGLLVAAVLCAVMVLWPRFPSEEDVVPVVGAPRLLWAKDMPRTTGGPPTTCGPCWRSHPPPPSST